MLDAKQPETKSFEAIQFRVLYRQFRLSVIDIELLSPEGDPTKLFGQFAALLLGFSFLVSLPILLLGGGRMPPEPTWTTEHFLIATTMVAIGVFSVLSWDSVFPDRRDVLVLRPLPVRIRTIFLSKLAALTTSLAVPIVALNAFTGLLWPLLFSSPASGILGAIRAIAAYWFTVTAAAVFVFGCTLVIRGAAAQLLPRQIFLHVSALLQGLCFCLFLTMYFLEPSLESYADRSAAANQHVLACLPTYWFLGLFQQLNGTMDPAFQPFAKRAWIGLVVTIIAAGAAIFLAYFRSLRKLVEEPEMLPRSHRPGWSPRLGNNLDNAILGFTARTLLRSRQHRIVFSFYLAVGFTIMLVFLNPSLASLRITRISADEQTSVPYLAASILMMCVVVIALRVVFSLPTTLRANWIFRITEIRSVTSYTNALRRSLLILVVCPIWAAFAVLFLTIWPWRTAAPHLLVLALLAVVLCEMSLYRFHKLPFTCSYLPGKANMQFGFWIFLALLLLSPIVAGTEWKLLQTPTGYATLFASVAGLAAWARLRTAKSAKQAGGMKFDESDNEGILTLNLSSADPSHPLAWE